MGAEINPAPPPTLFQQGGERGRWEDQGRDPTVSRLTTFRFRFRCTVTVTAALCVAVLPRRAGGRAGGVPRGAGARRSAAAASGAGGCLSCAGSEDVIRGQAGAEAGGQHLQVARLGPSDPPPPRGRWMDVGLWACGLVGLWACGLVG
jgi:hypothetical protein